MSASEKEQQEFENFRAYHSLQYDRIDKLESRREIFSSIVLTATLGVLTFAFSKENQTDFPAGSGLASIVILGNIVAIIFSSKTRKFVKMHQKRAKMALDKYAPDLSSFNAQIGKPDSDNDLFRRERLYNSLHLLSIFVMVVIWCSAYLCLKVRPLDKEHTVQSKIIHTGPSNTTYVSLTVLP